MQQCEIFASFLQTISECISWAAHGEDSNAKVQTIISYTISKFELSFIK